MTAFDHPPPPPTIMLSQLNSLHLPPHPTPLLLPHNLCFSCFKSLLLPLPHKLHVDPPTTRLLPPCSALHHPHTPADFVVLGWSQVHGYEVVCGLSSVWVVYACVAVSCGTFSSCGFDGEFLGVKILAGCAALFLIIVT